MTDLLTRAEAAKVCRVSLRAFEAHVRPDLTPVRIGRRVLFDRSDLDAWLDTRKDGASGSRRTARSTRSTSPTMVVASTDPRGARIRSKLQRRLHGSTPTSSNVNRPSAASSGVVIPLRSRSSSNCG
ncbi:MAG: DNA-binding protein [Anaerolineae bacterium]|nr:MAG: DNA-binding protein [Anaerolineae bacterium]